MNRFSSRFSTSLVALALLAAATLLPHQSRAASFGATGYTNAFSTLPVAADWSYTSIAGDANTVQTTAQMDANVNPLVPTAIVTATASIAMDPPDLNAAATWSSTGFYLQTRPTGNGMTALMLTLVNNSGSDPGVLNISYDLNIPVSATEGLEGHRGYYRTGASGWVPIPAFEFPLAGRIVANVDVSWAPGTPLYLLWGDDNGNPSPDSAIQIDNISVRRGTPTAVGIAVQPKDLTVIVGFAATLTVSATGTSPTFQWQKETAPNSAVFTNIPGATATNYSIASAQLSHSGRYRVIVSNSLGSVTSQPATLSVVIDQFGPRMLSAIVAEGGASNRILVTWDERLNAATASTMANFVLTPAGSTNRVPLANNPLYNMGPPVQTILTVATNSGATVTNNWYPGGATNYILTVNNIRDITSSNNVVAPNSQISIGWPLRTNVIPVTQVWQYHTSWFFDDLYNTNLYPVPWYATNFTGTAGFGEGAGPFYHDIFLDENCLGPFNTDVGFQRQPSQFRTWFNWPAGAGTNAQLQLRYTIDDGAVFYLNGVEIAGSRDNVGAGNVDGPNVRSVTNRTDPLCSTNTFTVNNLRPGTSNLMAVGVYQQSGAGDSDLVMGLLVDLVSFRSGPVPTSPGPVMLTNFVKFVEGGTNKFRMGWNHNGYALEWTTNKNWRGSMGPWFEAQPNMSNPFTNHTYFNNPGDPFRIYRLRKVNHGSP